MIDENKYLIRVQYLTKRANILIIYLLNIPAAISFKSCKRDSIAPLAGWLAVNK